MTWLVTGGAGFIGSALCYHLASATNDPITVVDKLTYAGNAASLAPLEASGRVTLVQADIADAQAMMALVSKVAPRGIFHLAAETHVDRSIDGPGAFVSTNLVGTYAMLEAARGYVSTLSTQARDSFRFVHVSTDEVFGSLGDEGVFTETSAYNPSSPYSASKAGADHLARAWHYTYGLPVIVSNCSNNYGPRQFPEKLIPLMILNALHGRALPVYGDGSNVRDWLHVEDHAAALLRMAEVGVPGETYCVGGGCERTNLEIVADICAIMQDRVPRETPYTSLIDMVKDRPGHDYRYAVGADKIKRDLAWTPKRTFAAGLEETVDWYLVNQDWWRPLRENIYAGERLGHEA